MTRCAVRYVSMAKCESCGAEINWTRMMSGTTLPLDPLPSADGVIQLLSSGHARVIPTEDREHFKHVLRYHSHYATCPVLAEQRKGRPKSKPDA